MKSNDWSAASFFKALTEASSLAVDNKFTFCIVSGPDGFIDAMAKMQHSIAFVCVSDTADGYIELNNTPRSRRVKTVFLAMRHKVDDMAAREQCMDTMRELFRQFMSVLIREKVRLQNNSIYLDPRISFQEIDRYFFSGCACAFFSIAVDIFTDLRFDPEEWLSNPLQSCP